MRLWEALAHCLFQAPHRLSFKTVLEPANLGLPEGEEAILTLAIATDRFRSDYVDRALAHSRAIEPKPLECLALMFVPYFDILKVATSDPLAAQLTL